MASRAPEAMSIPDSKSQFAFSTASTLESPISFENRIEDDSAQLRKCQPPHGRHLVWPAVMVCVPMIVLSTALLAVVFGYEIKPNANIFGTSLTPDAYRNADFILVQFSDTKIVFMASFLSTAAPLLAGCVMIIESVSLLRDFQPSAESYQTSSMSGSDQVRLLLGLSSASYIQLMLSLKSFASKKTTGMPKTVIYAASLLLLTVLMSVAVTVADAALHMLTETIDFMHYLPSTAPEVTHGRGLNAYCADFDRVGVNYGFPCTIQMNDDLPDPNVYNEMAEAQKLAHNTSETQEIRISPETGTDQADVAYLLPKSTTIDPTVDFQASTFGVSAKCSLIPVSTCNLTRWGPYDDAYTSFNCSKNFWGTLGLAQNVSAVNAMRQPSPYLPLLAIKPQSNLEYSFFTDRNLETIYNPSALNDSALSDENLQPTPDSELATTIYMAFAWRAAWTTFINGESNEMITSPSNLTGVYPGIYYLDYFLNCAVTSYMVEYVWMNNNVDPASIAAHPLSNGTLLNMWQATAPYGPSVNGGGIALQDINTQAAVAGNTTADYETRFGELLAQMALSRIGGYTSPRTVMRQQSRQEMLLAKVPKASLGSLVACSLLYPVLGILLLIKARRSLGIASHQPTAGQSSNTNSTPTVWSHRHLAAVAPVATQVSASDPEKQGTRVGTTRSKSRFPLRFTVSGRAGAGPELNFDHLQT